MNSQIKEMAQVYEEARTKAIETLGSMNEGAGVWYAKAFYDAGYRIQADMSETSFQEDLAFFVNDCTNAQLIALYEAVGEKLTNKGYKGYRKASDTAREIIADLVKFADDKERQMSFHGHSVWFIDADDVTDFIAELKEKYGVEDKYREEESTDD